MRIRRTNLILDYGVTDIVDKATKLIRILGVVEETLGLALLRQRLEFSINIFQFPNGPFLSESVHGIGEYRQTVPERFSWILP